MDFARILRTLRRRWYVVSIGLLLTIGLSGLTFQAIPFTYQANGSVLLLPPGYDKLNGSNPFLQLGGLDLPASVVAAYLEGEGPQADLARVAPTAKYTVAIDSTTRGPVLSVQVDDKSRASTMFALDAVLNAIPAALNQLQSQLKVGSGSTIGSMRLAVDTHPTVVRKATLRAVVAVFAVGLVLTLMTAVALDTLLDRPRRGRARDDVELDAESEGGGPQPITVNQGENVSVRSDAATRSAPVEDRPPGDVLPEEAFAELETLRSR